MASCAATAMHIHFKAIDTGMLAKRKINHVYKAWPGEMKIIYLNIEMENRFRHHVTSIETASR